MLDPRDTGHGSDSPEARAYQRGFRQKSKWDDYALDLFTEARTKLGSDRARVDRALRELSRLYNPLVDGPIVDLATRTRIMGLLESDRLGEAQSLLDERYRLYAPLDDTGARGPAGPGA